VVKNFIANKRNKRQEFTWKQLSRAPQTLKLPFNLILQDETEPAVCEEIVRNLPGKRLVIFGKWSGKDVVIKLFLEPGRANLHFNRETNGLKILTESGIPTAKICLTGLSKKYKIPTLITERIKGARDLESLWRNRSHPETTGRLMHAVIIELATQHVMGIRQQDLHLGNMLVKNHKIYTLDAGSVDFLYQPLNLKLSLHHLALFFSQLGAGTQVLRHKLFALYCKSRGWQIKQNTLLQLERLTKKYLKQRLLNYQNKVLRNSSQFKKIKNLTTTIYLDKKFESEKFNLLLKNPELAFKNKNNLLKNGNSSTVAKYSIGDKQFVVKRYNVKNTIHWLRRCLRITRAQKSWQCAHILSLAGIATAPPVACIEKRFCGLRGKSYFVMEYIPGENLAEYFSTPIEKLPHPRKLAERIMLLIKQLTELKLSHGDLKATNFIVNGDYPILIDLDGMTQHFSVSETKRALQKELIRFQKNWDNLPAVQKLFAGVLLIEK